MTDDITPELPPLYESLTWLTPLSEERAARLVRFLTEPEPAEVLDMGNAVICIGASQIWGPPVEDAQPLDYAAALRALRGLVRPGGRLVYGEAIWSRAPLPAATASLSGRDDEYLTAGALLEQTRAAGFEVVDHDQADLTEWDVFEAGFRAGYERWLELNGTDHPAAAEVRRRHEQQRAAYEEGYRGVLGMAYLCLRA